jgi:hypothetical protein
MPKRRLLLILLLCLHGSGPVRIIQADIPLPLAASPTDRIELPLESLPVLPAGAVAPTLEPASNSDELAVQYLLRDLRPVPPGQMKSRSEDSYAGWVLVPGTGRTARRRAGAHPRRGRHVQPGFRPHRDPADGRLGAPPPGQGDRLEW